jgi:hypothetical protein
MLLNIPKIANKIVATPSNTSNQERAQAKETNNQGSSQKVNKQRT